ncbi:MAG: glycosyltransferase family A protein [Flavobacterium sp.]
MIVFYHNKYRITQIVSTTAGDFTDGIHQDIIAGLFDYAGKFENEILVWCDESQKDNLNIPEIESLFHHRKFLFSYNPNQWNYFDTRIGFVEDSLYINVNKEVRYPTWQMSGVVGAVHTSIMNACKDQLTTKDNFDYFLNSFAKQAMNAGLFCYSEPRLLLHKKASASPKSNLTELFKFTRQHYRPRWVFLLFLNLIIFEKKFPLLQFMISWFYIKRKFDPKLLNQIPLQSGKKMVELGTIDVLIPTIGRRDYLLDVLKNLENQTHLPKNVIIVEQNPLEGSESELDYIHNKKWPFVIKHHFTHQSGACNARNIALKLVESEFTFFADDDIIFGNDLLENTLKTFQDTGNEALLVAIHLKSQTIIPEAPKQFPVLGTSHAFVKSSSFKGLEFNMGFEFGFGEDNDFGMQIRNRGFDVLYISTLTILHLKAPMGGFRTKPVLRWHADEIQPKPSPTVMLYRLLYDTEEQLQNYKSMIFIKNLNSSFFKNPFRYTRNFRQKWDRSIHWAKELNKQ